MTNNINIQIPAEGGDQNSTLRPCQVVLDPSAPPVRAKFHQWESISFRDPKVNEVVIRTLAIVELEDGHIAEVKPRNLQFVDTQMGYRPRYTKGGEV